MLEEQNAYVLEFAAIRNRISLSCASIGNEASTHVMKK